MTWLLKFIPLEKIVEHLTVERVVRFLLWALYNVDTRKWAYALAQVRNAAVNPDLTTGALKKDAVIRAMIKTFPESSMWQTRVFDTLIGMALIVMDYDAMRSRNKFLPEEKTQ